MIDIEQAIKELEEKQGRKLTDKEREVIQGLGMMMSGLWNNEEKKE